jgi:thiol-disulfide isomerase/thioredoxin
MVGVLVMSGQSTILTTSAANLPNAEQLVVKFQNWWYGNKPPIDDRVQTPIKQFDPLPDVEFQTLDGKAFRLKELQGQVVLLNFWATWCIPCREEIPELNSLQAELQTRGLRIVGASLEDDAEGVNNYQKEVAKFEYQILLGGSDAKRQFQQSVLPTTLLIDRQGRIREKIIGARDRAGWEALVKPVLDEAPATASN